LTLQQCWWMVSPVSVPYVSREAANLAEEWETRFQVLPPQAGVIFVSIRAVPAEGGACRAFWVRLGVATRIEQSTGLSLIKHVLAEEIASGKYEIQGAVYGGVRCAGSSSPRPDAHKDPPQ
jgi:hypothetical protein